jgi:hypothetical protein
MRKADERIPKKTLEMKLRGRRPRGRPRTRWMDQVMRDVEKRGKKWTQVKQDREWEDRDRWRFLCNSRPKKLETTQGRRRRRYSFSLPHCDICMKAQTGT